MTIVSIKFNSLSLFSILSFFFLTFREFQFQAAILANSPSLHSFQIPIAVPVGGTVEYKGRGGRIKQRKRNIAKRRENSRQVSLVRTLIATPFYPSPPPLYTHTHTHIHLPLLNFRSAEDSTISGRGRLKLR